MNIFDKFRKSKKIITEAVEKELEKSEGEAAKKNDVEAAESDKARESEECRIRSVAKQYLPGDVSSEYAMKETANYVLKVFEFSDTVKADFENVFDKVRSGELNVAKATSVIANTVNTLLSDEKIELTLQKAEKNENDMLLKLWVILDFYGTSLKPEYSETLRKLRDRCSELISESGICDKETEAAIKLIQLEKECCELKKDEEKKELLKEKRNELRELLIGGKAFFVLYDSDCNTGLPYIGLDGRIELSSRYETAVALKKHYEDENMGHIYIRRTENADFDSFFKSMLHIGVRFVSFDNGTFPMIFPLAELTGSGVSNIIERFNCGMRGLFVRSMQYSARASKASKDIKGTEKEKAILEAMLTCRFNAYREFGNSIVYAFVNTPYKKGITLYTKKAFERAELLKKAAHISEDAFVAPGDHEYKIYDGNLNLRVTHRGEDSSLENSHICVFTSRKEAEQTRKHFERYGCNDSVVAVTYEELCGQLSGCAGVILDMSLYGAELGKKELSEVEKWKRVKEKIVVNLKKKEENKEENKENESVEE